MNFLSHYYFDQDKSPEFILGIAIPDIAGNFSHHYNQIFKNIDSNGYAKAEKDLINGINQHYRVDAIFHSAPLFEEYCHNLKMRIMQKPWHDKLPRLYFIVHVLFELVLDAYLIHREPAIVNRFYQIVKEIDPQILKTNFSRFTEMDLFVSKIFSNFIRFSNHEFLRLYEEDANLVIGLKRISQHHFKWQMNEKEEHEFAELIQTFRIEESPRFHEVFNYVSNQLKQDIL